MAFHGRELELQSLERAFARETSELWVVYGRRRVGKTALLERFAADKSSFFFTGGVEDSRAQVRRFVAELADQVGLPMLKQLKVSNWSEALAALRNHVATQPRKLVVILDEFQWMCRGTSSVLSDIQRLWDKEWRGNGAVHLVLCGSAVSFMVGEVLAQKSPLFGRRTGSIHLEPLGAREATPFFGKRSRLEQAEALITLGGIPAYLERFSARPRQSVRQTLDELAFQSGGYLIDEIDYVFSEQLDKKERYREITSLLSTAPRTLRALSVALGLNPGQVSFYLQRLLLLGLIEKHRPITMSPASKTVRYRLRDEYLRFYFQYIEPNLLRIRRSRGYRFDRFTGDTWDIFLGLGFEQFVHRNIDVVLEHLGAVDVVERVGSYWHAKTKKRDGVQIDIVIERADGVTHLVECKWSRKPVGKEVLAGLERQRCLYPNPKNHTIESVLIAASGATRAVREEGVTVLSLRELLV